MRKLIVPTTLLFPKSSARDLYAAGPSGDFVLTPGFDVYANAELNFIVSTLDPLGAYQAPRASDFVRKYSDIF